MRTFVWSKVRIIKAKYACLAENLLKMTEKLFFNVF
jgi:hypothetical protein